MEISKEMVVELRDRSCCSMMECKKALEKYNDPLMAEGYLKYQGCAICIHPHDGMNKEEAYDHWVEEMAKSWKEYIMRERDYEE